MKASGAQSIVCAIVTTTLPQKRGRPPLPEEIEARDAWFSLGSDLGMPKHDRVARLVWEELETLGFRMPLQRLARALHEDAHREKLEREAVRSGLKKPRMRNGWKVASDIRDELRALVKLSSLDGRAQKSANRFVATLLFLIRTRGTPFTLADASAFELSIVESGPKRRAKLAKRIANLLR